MENRDSVPFCTNYVGSFHGATWTVFGALSLKEKNTAAEKNSEKKVERAAETKKKKYYRCTKCLNPVALQGTECTIGEQSPTSLQINPHGYLHQVLTVKDAFNIFLYGSPTPADSWFPGYLWRLCICVQCGSHVGWSYHRVDTAKHSFVGLRRDTIIKD